MLTFVFIVLVTAHAGLGLECITNCKLSGIPLSEALNISAARCQQRSERSVCTVSVDLDFSTMRYSATFGERPADLEWFDISPTTPLDYTFSQQCSTDTDCVIHNAQKRMDDLIGQSFDATTIYGEIAPIISPPITGDPIKCFDYVSGVVTCASGDICYLLYDTLAQAPHTSGCVSNSPALVLVYGTPAYASTEIRCKSDLCNSEGTYGRIKAVLNKYNLVDANGRINITRPSY